MSSKPLGSDDDKEGNMGMAQHMRMGFRAANISAALMLLTTCRGQAITQAPLTSIVIESVRVVPLSHIEFEGRTNLSDGTCLLTQLSINDTPESWWPSAECVDIENGQWQIRVPLGKNGVPQELSREKQYLLRVWERGNPTIESEPFWFDLSGPPVLEE